MLFRSDVQKARRLEDDGASMLEITMFVPDSERERVETWLKDNEDAVAEQKWGVAVGDRVDVDTIRVRHLQARHRKHHLPYHRLV